MNNLSRFTRAAKWASHTAGRPATFIAAVIVIEAGPVYSIFMTGIRRDRLTYFQWGWIVCSFAAVLGLCAAAVIIPMRKGEKKILQGN